MAVKIFGLEIPDLAWVIIGCWLTRIDKGDGTRDEGEELLMSTGEETDRGGCEELCMFAGMVVVGRIG